MKKHIFLLPLSLLFLFGCSTQNNAKKEGIKIDMILKIDNKEIDVTWLNNDSVKELSELAKETLTINMHEYGGFEQTGSIGKSITRHDTQMDVSPGDIVLYNGNAISVFYSESSWSYTRLGHINMSEEELNILLNKSSVTFVLSIE